MISGLFISKEIFFPKALKKYQTLKRILFSFKESLKALLCKCIIDTFFDKSENFYGIKGLKLIAKTKND